MDVTGWVFLAIGIAIVLISLPFALKYEGSFFYWGFRRFRRALDEPVDRAPGSPRPWPTWVQATLLGVVGLASIGVALVRVVMGR